MLLVGKGGVIMNKTEKDIIECFTKPVKDELLNRNYEILKGWYEFCYFLKNNYDK